MDKFSLNQIEHITSVAYAIIHGDTDKSEASLSDGALLFTARLVEGLGKELKKILRPSSIRKTSAKTDLYDTPTVDAVIKLAYILIQINYIKILKLFYYMLN